MNITILLVVASLLILAALFTFAKVIFAIRELDADAQAEALSEMRKLCADSMIHIKANTAPEAVQAQAQLMQATEFLENPEDYEPEPPRPKIVKTVHGEEIDLRDYDLI